MKKTALRIFMLAGIISTITAGVLLGILIDRIYISEFSKCGFEPAYPSGIVKLLSEEKSFNRMTDELRLNRSQIQAIGGILRVQSEKIKNTQEIFKGNINIIFKDTWDAISSHLNSEQKIKYRKLIYREKKGFERCKSRCPC